MKRLGTYARTIRPKAERPEHRAFAHLAGMPVVGGNGFELLIDGEETFAAIFAAIDRAIDEYLSRRGVGLGIYLEYHSVRVKTASCPLRFP